MVQSEVIKDRAGRVYTIYGKDQADIDAVKKEVGATKYVPDSVQMFKNQRASQELDAMAAENNDLKERIAQLEEAMKESEASRQKQLEEETAEEETAEEQTARRRNRG